MENSTMKRKLISDNKAKILEPILVKLNKNTTHDIHIDKSEFKIGRGRDNDEIIMDTLISRKHCIIRYEGNGEWVIKNLSVNCTFVNDVALEPKTQHKLSIGDIVQFSINSDYKYVFTFNHTEENGSKKQRIEEELFNDTFNEHKTFFINKERQKEEEELKGRLENKQEEQLKFNLEKELDFLLKRLGAVTDDKERLNKEIVILEDEITDGKDQEKYLKTTYSKLSTKLKNNKAKFKTRIKKERQKWKEEQQDINIQEKNLLEAKMKEQMEKWKEEQQDISIREKNLLEAKMKEQMEKWKEEQQDISIREKNLLEAKMKEQMEKWKEEQQDISIREKNLLEAKMKEQMEKWKEEQQDISIREKNLLEANMKEQMEKWREEQQATWNNKMEDIIKKEKTIQAQLLTEKTQLEEKLEEIKKALKDNKMKSESPLGSKNEPGTSTPMEDSCILIEVLDNSKLHIIDTIDLTTNNKENNITSKDAIDKISSIMEEQLTCSICSELFINATTLNCMHTFCLHCINTWNKKRKNCPICRISITSMIESLVLNNFIEKMFDGLLTHMKDKRAEVIVERKASEKKWKGHKR